MESLSASSLKNASGRSEKTPKPLPKKFYERSTLEVASELLGKVLVVELPGQSMVAGRIVETEAYREDDPASHSSRGQTPRAAIMFGEPGRAYVYFIYGTYEMLNFVTEPEGNAGAVLIRALEPVAGEVVMAKRRSKIRLRTDLTSGPGKLCRAMGIQMSHNGVSLQGPVLRVIDDGFKVERISASPRVGITQATDKMWRYFITDHPFVSRVKENRKARVLR